MTQEIESKTTQYGFQYGAARVERCASHKGYVVVGISTPKHRLDITVTPSGLIRVSKPVKNDVRS